MLSSGNNLSGSSGITSSDMPPLPQCLPLDPITLGNQKYTGSRELRRVLGVPLGSNSEDHSFGVPHPKPMAPVASGELKHFKESIQDAYRKARDRAKMLRESIVKLDRYRETLSSKKRQRTDLSSDRGGGVNLTKLGSQVHRNPNDTLTQRSEAKTSSSILNKRIRTSVPDLRQESRSAAAVRQQMITEKDANPIQMLGGGSVRIEEKTRRLLAGGEGLDQKIKKKRSVGAVGNRVITGDRDVKRATLPKASADLKMQFYDTQGFRLKSLPGASGINKPESTSEPTNSGLRTILGSEQEGGSVHRDHMAASEQRVVAKGNNRANTQDDCRASSPNTVIKNKVSRAPRTGSATALDSSKVQPSPGTFPCSSINPMTQWVGQRPHKNSRSRRVNVVSPVSRNVEAQVSSEGCPASDFSVRVSSVMNNGYQLSSSIDNNTEKYKRPPDDISSPFGLSESEESGAVENKIKEKGVNNCDFALAADKAGSSKLQMRRNKIPTDEYGDCVQRQGRTGRNLSLKKPGLSSGRGKSENLPVIKPVQNMRLNDNCKTKYGRPPSKKQKDRKALTCIGQTLNNGSIDFAGEYDDHEELCQAANSACNASNLACSGPFWKKLESIFATISMEDASYLKQQLNFAEELENNLFQMFGIDHDIMGVVMNNKATHGSEERQRSCCDEGSTKTDALNGKYDVERLDKVPPLFQRLLSALIEEDESEEELYHNNEAKNIGRQCASDDSYCDSCNQIDFESKDRDKMDSEVESKVNLQILKNCLLDRLSCYKSTASNTFRYPNTSSSLQSNGVWQGDDEFSHSDITHASEICSNDFDQLQPAELSVPGFPSSDSQYQLMCLDDRVMLELQSIGLYPEILPDLAEEDEALNQDIVELKKAMYQQIGKKKKNLDKIDRAIQKGRDTERRKIEQVAFDQLIELAYRKRLACRVSKNSKGAVHKVSKQAALVFLNQALERCKRYEETGYSCFNEPGLQHIIFSAPSCENVAKSADCIVSGTASNTCNKASHQVEARKPGSVSGVSEKSDSHRDNFDVGQPDSFQGSIHSSEQVSSKNGSLFIKEKRKEMLVNGVVGGSSPRASNLGGPVHGGVKGKRSERDRNQSRDLTGRNSISRAGRLSLDSSRNEYKTKARPKQKGNPSGHQDRFVEGKEPACLSIDGSSQSVANAGNNGRDGATLCGNRDTSKVKESAHFGNLQLPELDSIEELGVSGDLGGHQDLSSWLNFDEDGLQDHDSIGLEIPMDDLSELNMLM